MFSFSVINRSFLLKSKAYRYTVRTIMRRKEEELRGGNLSALYDTKLLWVVMLFLVMCVFRLSNLSLIFCTCIFLHGRLWVCILHCRRDLYVNQQVEILQQYIKSPKMSRRESATKLEVFQPLLNELPKDRMTVRNAFLINDDVSRERKRDGKNEEVETVFFEFIYAREKDIPAPWSNT